MLIFFLLASTLAATLPDQLQEIENISRSGMLSPSCESCSQAQMLESGFVINGQETNEYPAVEKLSRMFATPNNFGMAQSVEMSLCTATRISPVKILTAAHCVHDLGAGEFYRFAGSDLKVKAIHVHPQYEQSKAKDSKTHFSEVDLAVIELATPSPGPVMELDLNQPKLNSDVTMIGFGNNVSKYVEKEDGSYALEQTGNGVKRIGYNRIASLKGGILRINGRMENRNLLGWHKLFFGQLDLVDGSEASLSKGDSGGPLLQNGKLIGIASSGDSAIGLPRADGRYESRYTPLYTPQNVSFLKLYAQP